ncbi:MAG: Fe-S cluster assembly ATPase SufC [Acidimicrobiales bacterium]|jgi:Fe-S cluster assembly ATP-binding protein
MSTLVVDGLTVAVGGVEILRGINLEVRSGEIHAVMGPNGAGKSTLSNALFGHPEFVVTGGSVTLDGTDLLALPTWERAALGLFLAPQYPVELPGVRVLDVLAEALAARRGGSDPGRAALERRIAAEASEIGLGAEFVARALNVDASGGEKKRLETLQLAVLGPGIAILDELDSGLDVDALRDVARRIERAARPGARGSGHGREPLGVLAITHYKRLLDELRPDRVHVLFQGRIVESGGPELAETLERTGYQRYGEEPAS